MTATYTLLGGSKAANLTRPSAPETGQHVQGFGRPTAAREDRFVSGGTRLTPPLRPARPAPHRDWRPSYGTLSASKSAAPCAAHAPLNFDNSTVCSRPNGPHSRHQQTNGEPKHEGYPLPTPPATACSSPIVSEPKRCRFSWQSGFGRMRVRVPPRMGSPFVQESSALRADSVPTLTPCSLASFRPHRGYWSWVRRADETSVITVNERVAGSNPVRSSGCGSSVAEQSDPHPMLAHPGRQNTQQDHEKRERADETSVIFSWALEESASRPRAAFRSSPHARLPDSAA